jgi:hypothetical protein
MSLLEICQWLENTELAVAFSESRYLYPLVEAFHVLGLSLSVGLIVLTDLRLIGAYQRRVPVADILQQLRPWLIAGFIATFISGALLFWPSAATLYASTVFRLKVIVMLLAAVNALAFELRLGRTVELWGQSATLPRAVKLAGWISLSFWTAAVVLGRLIAYYPDPL